MKMVNLSCLCLIGFFSVLSGCQSTYYSAMEKIGFEKRDILVDRVSEARSAQKAASEQFESALEEFSTLTQYDGSDLQDQYARVKKAFKKSENKAKQVTDRIKGVENVGGALFSEWKAEINKYSDSGFKTQSQNNLKQTEKQYQQLVRVMRQSEGRISPVLDAFRDRVLFLKHNLNARALTSLQGEVSTVQTNVSLLVADMQKSIQEADKFIQSME